MTLSASPVSGQTLSVLLLAVLIAAVVLLGLTLLLRRRAGRRNPPTLWVLWGVLLSLLALLLIASALAGRGPLWEPTPSPYR